MNYSAKKKNFKVRFGFPHCTCHNGSFLNNLPSTLQSWMNSKLSQQRFLHCHENGLIKTLQMIPPHTTTFKFCRQAHLLDKLLMSKINLHISSNFFKLLCIGKRCFQPEVAKSSQFMCFINSAPMLVQIFSWTGVSEYQKLNLYAPATADKFLIEKHMNKFIWRNLWMMLFGKRGNREPLVPLVPPACL